MTPFGKIYDRFYGKVTDDMYIEWTLDDTAADMKNILLDAIPRFEFPRFAPFKYDTDAEMYDVELTEEEINILAILMVLSWLNRQIASVELIRMKYTGSDFKLTSQANHLLKLFGLKEQIEQENTHLQRLYKRRKIDSEGNISSNWAVLGRGDPT